MIDLAFRHSVAGLVARHGGDEALVVAAFARPRPVYPAKLTLEEWRVQRSGELAAMGQMDDRDLLVAVATASQALVDLLQDLKYEGVKTWAKYPVPNMEVFWYFREVLRLAVKRRGLRPALVGELGTQVKQLSTIVFG